MDDTEVPYGLHAKVYKWSVNESLCLPCRVCGICLRMLSVSLVGVGNWEWRSKEEDQETILQCSPCASQRTPVPARARWPLALSSRVRARDVVDAESRSPSC